MAREISVRLADSKDVGSCNACTANITIDGVARHDVWEITLRGCSVRVCGPCRKVLAAKLMDSDRR